MHKRLKMHGAETLVSAYVLHSYAQGPFRPASKLQEKPLIAQRAILLQNRYTVG